MAKKNSSKTATQTSISNSQPRIQVIGSWQGINWATMPYNTKENEINTSKETWRDRGQSDSKPNFLAIQNNLCCADNGTIETIYEPIKLNEAPTGKTLTGVACCHKNKIYVVAVDNQGVEHLYRTSVPTINDNFLPEDEDSKPWTLASWDTEIPLHDNNHETASLRKITSIQVFANSLIVLCRYNDEYGEMFSGPLYNDQGEDIILTSGVSNAKPIPDPATLPATYSNLNPSPLGWTQQELQDHVVRLTFKAIYTNKYGTTKVTRAFDDDDNDLNIVWVPDGPDSFTAKHYINLSGTLPTDPVDLDHYGITGLDIYCSQDESTDTIFCGHVNIPPGESTWSFNWLGAMMDTTQWTTSMLTIPDLNTTRGADACYCDQYDGRLYFYGGSIKERLYIGGNPGMELSVATGYGGAFLDIEPGSGFEIRKVLKFKTYNGATTVTILTYHHNTNKAARYNVLETNITLTNDYATKGYDKEKVDSVVGCSSYYGANTFIDGLYAVNRYGLAFTTNAQENQNNLKVMYCSDAIKPIFTSVLAKDISQSRLLAINNDIYLSFADTRHALATNEAYDTVLDDFIFVYDTDLKAWSTLYLEGNDRGLNPIKHIFHLDSEDFWEGVCIVRPNGLYLKPTTGDDYKNYYRHDDLPRYITNQSGNKEYLYPKTESFFATHEITGRTPVTNIIYVDTLEFRFDYLCSPEGLDIWVEGVDYYGRQFKIDKTIVQDKMSRQTTVYLLVRKYVEGIQLFIKGKAHYRLTQVNMKAFQKQNRIGSHFGFDTRAMYKGHHNTLQYDHHRIKSYNDFKYMMLTS